MQHSHRRTEVDCRHRSKQALTASSTSARVAKYRLWVASRRVDLDWILGPFISGKMAPTKARGRCARADSVTNRSWPYTGGANRTSVAETAKKHKVSEQTICLA